MTIEDACLSAERWGTPGRFLRWLRRRHFVLGVAKTPSFFPEGNQPKILSYSPEKNPHFEQLNPGVGYNNFVSPQLFCQTIVWVALCAAVDHSTPSNTHPRIQQQRSDVVKLTDSSMKTLVAFLLGGFVSACVAAWKERRTNYASLIGSMRNLLVAISASVTAPTPAMMIDASRHVDDTQTIRETRAMLGRYS
eukprot:CAMPEP_0174729044 /NCGR_PEP_ID=MMETSP1094-20130205/52885_1 /TAXON_ID=156173 /ORGANISM="Chrysochromulina brevifilum, Strain UTEX LB 985" /LENGTH=192 /DNA_ID=CAMNT_0015931077 /DNA_START=9 /DNA_END=584 /DNA_ORIENTATION=+